jgi:peroxiredoxin
MATQALPAELGTRATDFALKDVHGQLTKLADVRGQNGTVVVFICNHCPYVKAITDRLVRDAETLKNEGVSLVTINSNDAVSYPEDSFENMARFALERGFTFPYLHDETQEVARAYGARVRITLSFAFLAPAIVKAAVEGRLPLRAHRFELLRVADPVGGPAAARKLMLLLLDVRTRGRWFDSDLVHHAVSANHLF